MLYQQMLDFLSAYYPRYLCPPCLAALLEATEEEIGVLLTRAISKLEFATANCLNCSVPAYGIRFDGRAG